MVVEIDEFDTIEANYSGHELLEILDKVFTGFDSLCEMHGILTI